MKHWSILTILAAVLFTLSCISCNKGSGSDLVNRTNYYRLDAFETGVIPQSRQVRILFQVKDYWGNGVDGLTLSDFIVTENGGRIDSEASLKVDPDSIPYSLKTVLLLDVSSSVTEFVPQIKEATKALVNQKLDRQEIAIYTFDSQTKLIQDFTTDTQTLIDAIEALPETGLTNSTNLYGGILSVANLWEDSYAIDNIEAGNLIVFTDGRHNATQSLQLSDATSALQGKKVYVAALNSVDLDENALKAIASAESNYFKADNITALEGTFIDIQNEISTLSNSIYYMFYQSPITDPTPFDNALRVRVKDNTNPNLDKEIVEIFSSAGFGG